MCVYKISIYSFQGSLWRPLARPLGFRYSGRKIFGSDKQIYDGVTHRQTDRLLKITELHTDKWTDYWFTFFIIYSYGKKDTLAYNIYPM